MEIKGILAFALLAALAGCSGKHSQVANEEEATPPRLESVLRMGDTSAGTQLVSGFYPLENGSWRWTGKKFSVLLRTPSTAAQQGADLTFAFNVPDTIIQNLKTVALSASANGTLLKSAEYKAAGAYVFTADVPANLLSSDTTRVDFALDKSLPPAVDKRELGIIATSVGLTSK